MLRVFSLADWLRAALAALATACIVVCATAADPPVLALSGGSVFDPLTGLMQRQTVIIEGDLIRRLAAHEDKLPTRAQTLDCSGKFIIPGLIDAHVHLVHLANHSHVAGDQILPMFLANGVTSVRDTGDAIVAESVIARYAELRPELCPRVFLASPLIDRDPPFHRDIGHALVDPAQVQPFVKDMAGWNVTTLKLYVGTTAVIGRRVIAEGHAHGMKVTGHLGAYSAQEAVADGIDCLEHIETVFNFIIPSDVVQQPDRRANLDLSNPLAQSLITALVERGVNVDPTLVVFRNMIYLNDSEAIHKHEDLKHVPKRMLDYWHAYRHSSRLSPTTRESREKLIRKYQELAGLLHQRGVTLLVGTDAPEPFVPPGFSMHQELQMLVEGGMTPAAALKAATINVARAVNQEQHLGTIAPGKLADLVILDADPTQDIRHTRRIHRVVRGGIVCDPQVVLKAVPAE